ncbi:hypothetical protein CsSME_00053090 [Camellia sinensis var. sinensis]
MKKKKNCVESCTTKEKEMGCVCVYWTFKAHGVSCQICQKGGALPKKAGLRREANLTPLVIWDLTRLLAIGLISVVS